MCRDCYEEYGEPVIVTDATKRAAALIKRLYDEFAPCGGNLHIVTDDWNIEDSNIAFCRRLVTNGGKLDDGRPVDEDPRQLKLEAEILDLIEPMSEDERASALGLWKGYVPAVTASGGPNG